MQHPRPAFGVGEIRHHRAADDLQAIAHAREQPVELVVTQIDLAGQELADARLVDAAESGQLRLGDAGFQHHLTKQLTPFTHFVIIAKSAMSPTSLPPEHSIPTTLRLGRAGRATA